MKQSNILEKKKILKSNLRKRKQSRLLEHLYPGQVMTQMKGLLETPKRVIKAYKEFFAGYFEDPHAILSKTFERSCRGYDEMVIVKNIKLNHTVNTIWFLFWVLLMWHISLIKE